MLFRSDANAKMVPAAVVAGVMGAVLLTRGPVIAAGFKPSKSSQAEILRNLHKYGPHPSTDTRLVTIKMAAVTYRIPRNYLIYIDEEPTLSLTWPGLKPLTEQTRKCFGSILQSERVGCTSIKFMLHGSGGPIRTNVQMLNNFLRNNRIVATREGPFGYTIYDTGPKNARTETYTKTKDRSSIIFFHCMMSDDGSSRLAVCDDWFKLTDGNWIHFFFRYSQIQSITEIETGLRRLMESFRVQRGSTP